MTVLSFVQNQEYEGILITHKKAGVALPIDGASEIVLTVYEEGSTEKKFQGKKSTNEITFVTDGTDGLAAYAPGVDDMDTAGIFLCEIVTTLASKEIKKQSGYILVKPEGPA